MKAYRLLPEDDARDLGERLRGATWHEGQARAVTGTVKRNCEIIPSQGTCFGQDAEAIEDAALRHPEIAAETLLVRISPPKFNRYDVGMSYGRHYDASPMTDPGMRTDFAFTLCLSDGFHGGELIVDGKRAPELRPGQVVAYPCGALHEVTEVTRGSRISAIWWGRSLIRDPLQRQAVADMGRVLRKNAAIEPFGDDYTTLTGIHAHLLRMWSDA